MNLTSLRRPFVILQTVPAAIALSIGLLSPIIVYAEMQLTKESAYSFSVLFEAESARMMLSIVAGGAMSALTLTYSLVLEVFTLAAGNIGPRMLKRFTSDIVNQVTAGIFGGTFLYALLALLFVEQDFVQKFTVIGSGLLAILCVMQLIFFVRHVSKSVTIDDEIADITDRLKTAIEARYSHSDDKNGKDDEYGIGEFCFEIKAQKSGYVNVLEKDKLVEIAKEKGLTLSLRAQLGIYTLKDELLIEATEDLDEDTVSSIQDLISIQPSRSEDSPIEFSINLLIEIALRALSPGVNDTFTGMATVDSLSNALSEAVARGRVSSSSAKDEDGKIRLIMPETSVERLVNQAFHPLRRAAAQDILMAQCLARAYVRIHNAGGENMRKQIENHGTLLIRELEKAGYLDEDIDSVAKNLPMNIRKKNNKQDKE
ncbi:DUF2254 domain-containing protein [Sneathiella sp.]|uniref:DUF2254 domain-containing protein n=1 Tax=Sneathiella sp. TaxID=1964365 RepID=UPI00356909C5